MKCVRCKKELVGGGYYCSFCGKRQTGTPVKKRKRRNRAHGTGSIDGPFKGLAKPYRARKDGVCIGYFATYNEADAALRDLPGMRTDIYNITLAETFEEIQKDKRWKEISTGQQKTLISAFKYFSSLHDQKIRTLRARDYQQCIDQADDDDLSLSHQQKMRQCISKVCKWALDNDLVRNDYSKLLYIPGVDKSVRKILPDDAIQTLFQHSDERAAGIICFLIGTGMRPADLRKIKKDDAVDLKNHGLVLEGSKSKAGKGRYVSVIAEVWPIFLRFYMAAPQGGYVFPGLSGGQLDTKGFRLREFYPCLDRLGIMDSPYHSDGTRKEGREDEKPEYLLYNCRHTFASLSNKAGVDKEILQKSIGHVVGSEVTDQVYIHQQADEYSEEFKKLGNLLDGIIKKQA